MKDGKKEIIIVKRTEKERIIKRSGDRQRKKRRIPTIMKEGGKR